ncbi:MAG: hypothetical protein RR863_02825 [Erysipelotrichaceae bacterium]
MKHVILKIKNWDFKVSEDDYLQFKGKIGRGVTIYNLYGKELLHFAAKKTNFVLLRSNRILSFDIYIDQQIRGTLFPYEEGLGKALLYFQGHNYEIVAGEFQGDDAYVLLQDHQSVALMIKNNHFEIYTRQSDKTSLCAMLAIHLRFLGLKKIDKNAFLLYIEPDYLNAMNN